MNKNFFNILTPFLYPPSSDFLDALRMGESWLLTFKFKHFFRLLTKLHHVTSSRPNKKVCNKLSQNYEFLYIN